MDSQFASMSIEDPPSQSVDRALSGGSSASFETLEPLVQFAKAASSLPGVFRADDVAFYFSHQKLELCTFDSSRQSVVRLLCTGARFGNLSKAEPGVGAVSVNLPLFHRVLQSHRQPSPEDSAQPTEADYLIHCIDDPPNVPTLYLSINHQLMPLCVFSGDFDLRTNFALRGSVDANPLPDFDSPVQEQISLQIPSRRFLQICSACRIFSHRTTVSFDPSATSSDCGCLLFRSEGALGSCIEDTRCALALSSLSPLRSFVCRFDSELLTWLAGELCVQAVVILDFRFVPHESHPLLCARRQLQLPPCRNLRSSDSIELKYHLAPLSD